MIEIRIMDSFAGFIMLLISASDVYNGARMLIGNQHRLLWIARIGFWVLNFLPASERQDRYAKAMSIYKKRQRIYGLLGLTGGLWFMMLSVLIIINSITF